MVVPAVSEHHQVQSFTATITWMDEQPLNVGKTYLLQHAVNRTKAKITTIQSILNIETMHKKEDVSVFKLNDIGQVSIKTAKPIFADLYKVNPHNGAFILIDEFTNNTVAVGFIERI